MSSSDSSIKQLVVTGGAAEDFINKGTRRRRRSSARTNQTRKVEQLGGTSPGTIVQVQANRAPGPDVSSTNSLSQAKASNASNLAKSATNSASAIVSTTAKEQVGGTAKTTPAATKATPVSNKPVKVILTGGKKKTRVVLAPAKVRKMPGSPVTAPTAGSAVNKTRKVAKKIRMSLGGFGKRVTRANNIRHEAKKQTVEQVKKTLVDAKLIKTDSKAPESVLRQMYADYMVIKNRAL